MPMRRGNGGMGLRRRGVKQAFLRQLGLELLKRHLQRARAHGLQKFRGKLQLAARVIDGHAPARNHLHAGLRPKTQQPRLAAEHHDAKLRVTIFQREIKMPGLRRTEIRNLAFHPDVGIGALHRGANGAYQIGNAPDTASGRLFEGKTELVCE